MVRHALSLVLKRPCPVKEELWPVTPLTLMPPLDFIKTRVRGCYDDFIQRDEHKQGHLAGLGDVLADIQVLLEHSLVTP